MPSTCSTDNRGLAAEAGVLYVVATPIGNLEDITLRALAVLRSADLVAAEDTRKTAQLLSRHGITKSLVSYHDHNESRRTPELLQRLRQGASIALVSNAGTPGISDPGYRLVSAAAEAGLRIVPVWYISRYRNSCSHKQCTNKRSYACISKIGHFRLITFSKNCCRFCGRWNTIRSYRNLF
jgi:hypothetical protein